MPGGHVIVTGGLRSRSLDQSNHVRIAASPSLITSGREYTPRNCWSRKHILSPAPPLRNGVGGEWRQRPGPVCVRAAAAPTRIAACPRLAALRGSLHSLTQSLRVTPSLSHSVIPPLSHSVTPGFRRSVAPAANKSASACSALVPLAT